MSTITISYPNTREQHVPRIGLILILSILVLIAITLLVMVVSAKAGIADQSLVSQNSIKPISVPTPPAADIQPVPSTTPAPSLDRTSESVVVPVPVPTPPSP